LHFNHSAQNLRVNKEVQFTLFQRGFKAINVEELLEFGGNIFEHFREENTFIRYAVLS
jgi:hypothetical protein